MFAPMRITPPLMHAPGTPHSFFLFHAWLGNYNYQARCEQHVLLFCCFCFLLFVNLAVSEAFP